MSKTVTIKNLRHVDALVASSSTNWNWFRNIRNPNWYSILDMQKSSIDWEILPTVEDETLLMREGWDWRLPKFSTEMPAAWTEVERLVDVGYFFNLRTYTTGDWRALFKKEEDVGYSEKEEWAEYASTAQLAICKAILRMSQIRLVFLCEESVL